MNIQISLENEKKALLQNMKDNRIVWKKEFLKERSFYILYENYRNSIFPRSLVFRILTKYRPLILILVSLYVLRKIFLSFLLKIVMK